MIDIQDSKSEENFDIKLREKVEKYESNFRKYSREVLIKKRNHLMDSVRRQILFN